MQPVRTSANSMITSRRAIASRPSLETLGRLSLICLILIMPVSYRAGTDTPHAHAFFQGIIEALTGSTHVHDGHLDVHGNTPGAKPTATPSALSPFTAADIPLEAAAVIDPFSTNQATSAANDTRTLTLRPGEFGSDTPQLTDQKPPAELGSAISALTTLLITLLATGFIRLLWFSSPPLEGIRKRVEAPPPRFTSCIHAF